VPLSGFGWLFCVAVAVVGFIWGFFLRFIPMPAEKTYKGDVDAEDEDSETSSLLKA
jgi:hypothetical protein